MVSGPADTDSVGYILEMRRRKMMRKFVAMLLAAAALTCAGQDSYAKFSFKQMFKKERSALHQDTEAIFNQMITALETEKGVITQRDGIKKTIFGVRTPADYTETVKNLKSLKKLFLDTLKMYDGHKGQKAGVLSEKAARGVNKAEGVILYFEKIIRKGVNLQLPNKVAVDGLAGQFEDKYIEEGTYAELWKGLFSKLAEILRILGGDSQQNVVKISQEDYDKLLGLAKLGAEPENPQRLQPRRSTNQGQRRRPTALKEEEAVEDQANDSGEGLPPRRRRAPLND